ncbi:MAG TPA: ATP-binding protein, partial [Chroococcales cyanobacterium]
IIAGEKLVHITVEDCGIGVALDPDRTWRLFEPFEQLDGSSSRQFGGVGLGLAICKTLIEEWGGEIGVNPRAKGSSFWFTVPLKEQSATVESDRPLPLPVS